MLPDFHFASAPRGHRLAAIAALAYSLVIVYASLQPFTGWRAPAYPFGEFIFESWPRWITVDDVMFNFVAYVPLGFLFALSLHRRLGAPPAMLLSSFACLSLSVALECVQQYLPSRFASNVDLLVNSTGGAVGALIAPMFSPEQRLGQVLSGLRYRWFEGGPRGDMVLVLAGLWLVAQLHVPLIAFGYGDLRGTLGFDALFTHAPDSYLLAEAGVVALNVAGLGLMLATASRSTDFAYWRALVLLIAGACALKTAAAVLLLDPSRPWSWWTPGLGIGIAAALVALPLLNRLSRRGCSAAALLALLAAVVLVNSMPENPYRPAPAHLLAGRVSHFLSFAGMLRALSDLWPFLAALFLLFSLPWRHAADRE